MDDVEAVAEVRRIAEAAIARHTGHPYPEGIRSVEPAERAADGGAVVALHLAYGAHAVQAERALIEAGWWVAPLPVLPGEYGPRLRATLSPWEPPAAPRPHRPSPTPAPAAAVPPRPGWATSRPPGRRP